MTDDAMEIRLRLYPAAGVTLTPVALVDLEWFMASCRAVTERVVELPGLAARVDRLVEDFYRMPGNGAGGSLHIVLDDGNVDEDSVRFCLTYARDRDDAVGVALANVLLSLTDDDRDAFIGKGY